MVSNKVKKYLKNMPKGKYAITERKLEKSDLKKYKDRNGTWEAPASSNCNSHVKSGKVQEEVKPLYIEEKKPKKKKKEREKSASL